MIIGGTALVAAGYPLAHFSKQLANHFFFDSLIPEFLIWLSGWNAMVYGSALIFVGVFGS